MAGFKLVTAATSAGARAGLVVGETVYDVVEATGVSKYRSTLGILQDWDQARPLLQQAADAARGGGIALKDAKLLAPLPDPGVVFCTGSNYKSHSDAMERAAGLTPRAEPREQGLKPWVFLKPSRCVVGPDAEVEHFGARADWEAELAVVIGRRAKNVRVEDAMGCVAAYTIGNDLSARHRFVRPQIEETSPFRFDWVGHKCFDGACPTGPWLVPANAIADPQDLDLRLWVNDQLKQNSNTAEMIFNIAEQITQISSLITLQPGDLILTGTPAGVGAETGEFLKPGDQIRIEIESLGVLRTRIV
jgi:2-keto-4-pentenoate hydratase/2-oxohepta-3-ene-1,7-dioic acid hydratase in catechol pathway